MEHIGNILKQTGINTSKASTGATSSADLPPQAESECPVCKGARRVHPRLPGGKPDYSRTVPCRCVEHERIKERQQNVLKQSNLGMLSRLTFDNLLPMGRSGLPINQESFLRVYTAAKAYAAGPKGWFVISGPSGSGKTHLAAAIANEQLRQGHPAYYTTTPDLLDNLRSGRSTSDELTGETFSEQVRNKPLLILDDLGTQTDRPWAKEKLDQLLTYRFNNALPTVIVTIVPMDDIDERLRTRLTDPRLSQTHAIEGKSTAESNGGLDLALIKNMTFENFDHRRINLSPEEQQNLEMAYLAALQFAQQPEGWLVLMGLTGCGKTHLAAAIANYNRQAGKPVMFIVVPEFLDHLRSTFSPDSKTTYDELFEKVKTAPLLILDDFTEHAASPWAQEKLYQVINYRYNARLATVITMRASLDDLDSSVSSRLIDHGISNPINIIAPDYRGSVGSKRGKMPRSTRR